MTRFVCLLFKQLSKFQCIVLQVPTGAAIFPKDIWKPPRSWVKALYNVQQWSTFAQGGHFAAKEEPSILARDVQRFFGNKALFHPEMFGTR